MDFLTKAYTPGPYVRDVDMVIIHCTRGGNPDPWKELQGTLDYMLDRRNEVSSHYVVDTEGSVIYVVEENNIAWHAGYSNPHSIGIELVQAFLGADFPRRQIVGLASLLASIAHRRWEYAGLNPWTHRGPLALPTWLIGHDATTQGARWGKTDPGPNFPWAALLFYVAYFGRVWGTSPLEGQS